MTDTVAPVPGDTPESTESSAVLPPIDGSGGAGTGSWDRTDRKVYLTLELERVARALGELQ